MYSYFYKIQTEDINIANHVGNERSLVFFEEARKAFLKSLGLSELNIGNNIGLIQKSAVIEYKKQLFLGSHIEVKIVRVEFEKLFFTFFYEIYNQNSEICVEGKTKMLAYDYQNQKVKKVPMTFLENLR